MAQTAKILCPFPTHEGDVEDYLECLNNQEASPSSIYSGFLEAIRFCSHVAGIDRAEPPISVKAKRMSELADLRRSEKRQARALSGPEVESLEHILMDEKENIHDRFAAGALLFCLYSRSRLGDLKKVRGVCEDSTVRRMGRKRANSGFGPTRPPDWLHIRDWPCRWWHQCGA